MYCGHAIIYPTTTKYLTFFKMRFCFVSIIIRYGLPVVFCSSIALRAPAFLAPETLLDIHTENCQTVELDESTRCLTNKRCTSIFVVILFFAFFTSKSLVRHTGNHITSQSPVNCAGSVCLSYYFTHFFEDVFGAGLIDC